MPRNSGSFREEEGVWREGDNEERRRPCKGQEKGPTSSQRVDGVPWTESSVAG